MAGPEHPFFARFWVRFAPWADRRGFDDVRRRSLAAATGAVIEVGAGSGENFAFYPDTVTEVLAVEPEPYLRDRARHRAADARADVTVIEGTAEDLPAPDASADTVVTSLVLCSVGDLDRAVAEARRVLKPGGRLAMLEHVRAPSERTAHWQDRVTPAWRRLFAGCHVNRDTVSALEAGGFDTTHLVPFELPGVPVLRHHVGGYATLR